MERQDNKLNAEELSLSVSPKELIFSNQREKKFVDNSILHTVTKERWHIDQTWY